MCLPCCKSWEGTGISTEGLCFDEEVHTTVAVVQKKEDGDRDICFSELMIQYS